MFTSHRIRLPHAVDVAEQPISGFLVEYASLDETIIKVNRWTGAAGLFDHCRLGQVRMVARITAYGVIKFDAALFTVTWPVAGTIEVKTGIDVTFEETTNTTEFPATGPQV